MSLPPNPTDLDRLAYAWASFRALWNANAPSFSARIRAVQSKIGKLRA